MARFDETDASRLLEDPGIIRSLAKIEATVGVRAVKMQTGGEDFHPGRDWQSGKDEFPPALLIGRDIEGVKEAKDSSSSA